MKNQYINKTNNYIMSTFFALIFLIFIETPNVINQKDHDYKHPDFLTNQEYEGNTFNEGMAGKQRSLISFKNNIIISSKCLSKCILGLIKSCRTLYKCLKDCLFPDETIEDPKLNPKRDKEIKLSSGDNTSPDLNKNDIVRLFVCISKCVAKYLPHVTSIVPSWILSILFCSLNRCFCTGDPYLINISP